MDYAQLLGSASGMAVGAYLFAVVYTGNFNKLVDLLKSDGSGYAQFVIALLLLGAWHKYGPGGVVEGALTGIAVIAFVLKSVKENPNAMASRQTAAKEFAEGKMSLWVFVRAMITGTFTYDPSSAEGQSAMTYAKAIVNGG